MYVYIYIYIYIHTHTHTHTHTHIYPSTNQRISDVRNATGNGYQRFVKANLKFDFGIRRDGGKVRVDRGDEKGFSSGIPTKRNALVSW